MARENIVLNHVEDRVRAVEGDLCKSEAMPCDLAVANIVADAIRMLAAPLTRHLAKGGLLICSGIIREREQDEMCIRDRSSTKPSISRMPPPCPCPVAMGTPA